MDDRRVPITRHSEHLAIECELALVIVVQATHYQTTVTDMQHHVPGNHKRLFRGAHDRVHALLVLH